MAETKAVRKPLTKVMALHYIKLVCRSILFLTATVIYIINRVKKTGSLFGGLEDKQTVLSVIWIVFAIEMVLRFFPSKLESMGCQKQFAKNYKPLREDQPEGKLQPWWRTASVAGAWFLLNGAIGALYYLKIIDAGILVLISLAYSVCDMICILFFCPFQTWFMKNRCCATCRIYNWDFAMMFTPLVFVNNIFARTLVVMSLILLVKWEIIAHRHPERFDIRTNRCISCAECPEKLCHHKKQLQSFIQKYAQLYKEQTELVKIQVKEQTEQVRAQVKEQTEQMKAQVKEQTEHVKAQMKEQTEHVRAQVMEQVEKVQKKQK